MVPALPGEISAQIAASRSSRKVTAVPPSPEDRSGRGAALVAAGILASRVMGLVRQRIFAYYLGVGPAAAAYAAALRIPNFLQNLLGEGVLSASFIPVYASLRSQKDDAQADQVAGAIFGLLALCTGILVALGVTFTGGFVALIAPGFTGAQRELTVALSRILFPGTGLLVMSAWCLGILNSHRRFFLSYAAPVVWNGCIIIALVAFGGRVDNDALARWAAIGMVVGAFAQFAIQLPNVLRLLGRFRPTVSIGGPHVRSVLKNFAPAVLARGVVQISAWLDSAYASLITERAVAALTNAQTISLLPVSLFGMAVSAAELPEMSADAARGTEDRSAVLRTRISTGLQRIAFFVVPSAAAFLFIGEQLAGLLLQNGRFTAKDSRYVWYLLAAASVGLLSQTMGRLYSSAFWALKDVRTPLRIAALRVSLGAGLGYVAARLAPGWLGVPSELGAALLTATSGAVAFFEYSLLRRALRKVIGDVGLPPNRLLVLWGCALAGGSAALGVKLALTAQFGPAPLALEEWGGSFLPPPNLPASLVALLCMGVFSLVYGVLAVLFQVPQAQAIVRRLLRRRNA
jgi:putative peptidoglycan lipid II flippase